MIIPNDLPNDLNADEFDEPVGGLIAFDDEGLPHRA